MPEGWSRAARQRTPAARPGWCAQSASPGWTLSRRPPSTSPPTVLAPGHPVDPGHLGRIQLETLDVTVGVEAIELRRLGDHDDRMLDVPPDHDLRRRHAVSVRDFD